MATKITREILESYLYCKTKARLKLAGEQGNKSDYEVLLGANREEVRQQAIGKILAKHPEEHVPRDIFLTTDQLRTGPTYVLGAILEDDVVSLRFDGLKKVDGPSKLGDFHYVPILFHEGRKVGKVQRLLLELSGLFLSRLQGQMPSSGIIWHGMECRTTRLRLNADLRRTERLLREVKDMVGAESPPKLNLNNHCQVCEFRQQCHDQAVQEDNISLLRGVSEKEIRRYARKGIFTVTQLAHTFRPRRKGKRQHRKAQRHYDALQAMAVRDKRVYVFGPLELPASPVRIYLDVEGDNDEGYVYLIGMIVVHGDSETTHSFWADDQEQECRIFEEFLAEVSKYDDFQVFAYGSYERAFITRMQKRAQRRDVLDRVLKTLCNTLSLIYSHVYFPTYSNGLKDVARCLGCSWAEPNSSGVQSLTWRKKWELTHFEEWKRMIMTYNLEDCAALRKVTEFLYSIGAKPEPTLGSLPGVGCGLAIVGVEEIDRLGTVNRRGKREFFDRNFEHITNAAHFDYQRKRVYARTSKVLKKNRAKPRRLGNQTLRASRRIEVISRKCPFCGSTELERWTKDKLFVSSLVKQKRTFNLVFTGSAIVRRVVDFRSSIHECMSCGREFVPERYRRLAKHFHGLMSWVAYNQIVHRISPNKLEEMLMEFFGFAVCQQEINDFKSILAKYYDLTYRRLFKRIISGKVLYVDETEVRLRTGKGYVWVFANSEEVVYFYRPTREGDFLQELLKDFRGVLVSDFYTAYDSHECPQQKCLLHLIRDMNDELLANPFDEELQAITAPFGTLLREIVATIDLHGLRRRYLQKHEKDVEEFFRSLETKMFRSESAEALQKRLIKYEGKLFTFIKYDGVAWNNNNAENAIRQFAYYRDDVAGHLKEEGLRDYLVLLSISQTCRFRGASFLRFLLSRVRDIDAFCLRPGRRRRSPHIEVYPKGVERPDFRSRRMSASGTNTDQDENQAGSRASLPDQ